MKVRTIRLPEGLDADLVAEAEERDRSFSEYIRMLLRNREPNTNTQGNTQPNTPEHAGDYDRLRERVAELEERVDELDGGESLNQQPAPDSGPVLVNDDDADSNALEPHHPDANPHSSVVEAAVQWAKNNEPVRRAEIIQQFEDEVDIKGDSLWKKHIRDALKDAGFKHDRSGGIATWER